LVYVGFIFIRLMGLLLLTSKLQQSINLLSVSLSVGSLYSLSFFCARDLSDTYFLPTSKGGLNRRAKLINHITS